jgi:hypothetical protein
MKIKVDFNKLVWGYYHNFNMEIELEMINWLFKTGLEGNGYQEQHGWYKSGINQLLYGYSGNDEIYDAAPFPIHNSHHLGCFIRSIFVRAFIAPYSSPGFRTKIGQWREKNRIDIGKYRFFNFPDITPNDPGKYIWKIANYEGRELKKLFAHPDFPNRTHPKIIAVIFSTCGQGYFVKISFSFWEFNYEPGWDLLIAKQKEDEYIGDFLARAAEKLKSITVNIDGKRACFEKENNYSNFRECGCFNCIWYGHISPHACGCMECRGIKNCSITNPKNHLCDEWRYNYNLTGKFPNESVWRRRK